jgi:hypothetical protein
MASFVNTIATILAVMSGFAFLGYREPAANLIATSLAVDAALAPLTAIVAARRSRSPTFWAVTGFVFGMWALAYVLLVPRHHGADYPTESDAA